MSKYTGYYFLRRKALREARRRRGIRSGMPRWYGGSFRLGIGQSFVLAIVAMLILPYFLTMYFTRKVEDQSERKTIAIVATIFFWIIIFGIVGIQSAFNQTSNPYS